MASVFAPRNNVASAASCRTPVLSRIVLCFRRLRAVVVAPFLRATCVAAALGFAEPLAAQNLLGEIVPPVVGDLETSRVVAIIAGLLILQTALIVGLQYSRIRYKRAKKSLKESQLALEQRVIERTNKLGAINSQLYDEIAKHEITEERLQEAQNYLQSIINSMPSVLIGVTRTGTITHWNAAAERATDIPAEKAIGNHLNEVSPGLNLDLEMVRNAIDQGVAQAKEGIRHEFEGQVGYTDLIVYPLITEDMTGAVIRIDDVTTRVRFENMMIQNEKMMSLGELAAGMAHEINNPLSAILHAVQNINRRTSPSLPANTEAAAEIGIHMEQVQRYLEERGIYKFVDSIKEAGERSARIVTNMLEFSRTSSRNHEPVNMAELLEHSLELSHNSFDLRTSQTGTPVRVRTEFQPDLPPVPCSAAEIQQVILNILRNAAQAFIKDVGEGDYVPEIVLRAFAEDGVVRIQIADNGPGMPESTRRHIFEPFFTTKEVGKGTGLGLSVSYFIITEHHDGQIEVDSSPGHGTTFTITLPLTEKDTNALSAASPTRLI